MSELKVITREIKSSMKNRKRLELSLLASFLFQFVVTIYFNLFCIKPHTGFDSSWDYLKTVLIWNEKTLINPSWAEQNNFLLDTTTLPATIFYGITKNVFLSYGICNILILILIFWCLSSILTKMNIGLKGKLIALNLVICPYLTNGFDGHLDIGYFSNVISGATHSSVRVLIALLIIKQFITIKETNKFGIETFITFALCILTGASIGVFMLIMMFIPYIVYEIELLFITNDWKVLTTKQSIFGYICSALIFLGKVIMEKGFGAAAIDTTRTWTVLEQFWHNFGSVFLGFMKLLGVLPVTTYDEVTILSMEGLTRIYPIIIFAIIVLATILMFRMFFKDMTKHSGIIMFLLNIVVCNYLTFSLFNVQYGQYVFEDRYLITTFFAIIILVANFFNNLDERKIVTGALTLALVIAFFGNNIISDVNYIVVRNKYYSEAEAIDVYLDNANDSDLVYVWGNDLISLERIIRVYDLDRVYKLVKNNGGYYHFGDYTTYDNNSDYKGVTYLIIDSSFDMVPDDILEQYELVETFNELNLYRCEQNVIDYSGQ